MEINKLYSEKNNKKIFEDLTGVDFDSKVNELIKKLVNKDEIAELTFSFNIRHPYYIYIEKKTDFMPAIEYYKNYIENNMIKEIGIVFETNYLYILDSYKVNNKKDVDINNEYTINV